MKEQVASNNLGQVLEAINAQVDETELSNLSLPVQLQDDLDYAANLLTQCI
jgi:ribosomal protein L12E/L44/L45/RPP1/RPP2